MTGQLVDVTMYIPSCIVMGLVTENLGLMTAAIQWNKNNSRNHFNTFNSFLCGWFCQIKTSVHIHLTWTFTSENTLAWKINTQQQNATKMWYEKSINYAKSTDIQSIRVHVYSPCLNSHMTRKKKTRFFFLMAQVTEILQNVFLKIHLSNSIVISKVGQGRAWQELRLRKR